MTLFTPHPLYFQTAFSDLKRQAREQPFLFVGSAGTVSERTVNGRAFYYRQHYDALGKKTQDYVGAVDDPAVIARVADVRAQITTANGLLRDARPLVREGYVAAEPRTSAILAALANHAFFSAGGVLVGSHAYGALLNDLGARAGAHATEDLDVARAIKLALPKNVGFASMLADSKIELLPVRSLDRKSQPTSYKPMGHDRLRVDLLVPTAGSNIKTLPVPELSAHALALPFLGYLLEDPEAAVVIGREALVPVNVPRPEAFAFHKMLVSELRRKDSDKREKDLAQAAVLFAVLAERAPASLEDAFAGLPRGSKEKTRRAARRVLLLLEDDGRARAIDLMKELLAK